MKNFGLIALLLLAVACGESSEFFNKPRGKKSSSAPGPAPASRPVLIAATPEQLTGAPIVVNDGLVIKAEGMPQPAHVELRSIDPDRTYIVEYRLEKAEAITLPSAKPVMIVEMKGPEATKIPIMYRPTTEDSVTIDNLHITYYPKDEPENTHVITYPIRAESRAPVAKLPEIKSAPLQSSSAQSPVASTAMLVPVRVKEPVPARPEAVSISTLSKVPVQDFGRTIVGQPIDSRVMITNHSPVDVKIEVKTEKDEQFIIKDPSKCPETLGTGETCTITTVFDSKIPGIHTDTLIVEHTPVLGTETQVTKLPIIAEKIEDLNTCDGKPCATPFTEGTLISSEVFSNDIDFGSISVGLVVKKQVEIQNKGKIALKIKDQILNDQGVFSFSGGKYPGEKGTCGDILLPGSCVIEMSYHPSMVSTDIGSLKVVTKEGPSVSLKLEGSATAKKSCDSFNEYLVVPEASYPDSSVIFPYLKSSSKTKSKLSIRYGTQVNFFDKDLQEHTIKDGMVYITFKLPSMEGEIVNMNFGVNAYKIIRDNFKDTESLCLSSSLIRKCSGHEFSLASWQKLKNPKFWDLKNKPVNELFETQLAAGENKCGNKKCMSLNTRYELKEIFELSGEEFAVIRKQGLFTLIFSDDTRMLTMPRISVKTKIKTDCK